VETYIDLEEDNGIDKHGIHGTLQIIEVCNESIIAQLRVRDHWRKMVFEGI